MSMIKKAPIRTYGAASNCRCRVIKNDTVKSSFDNIFSSIKGNSIHLFSDSSNSLLGSSIQCPDDSTSFYKNGRKKTRKTKNSNIYSERDISYGSKLGIDTKSKRIKKPRKKIIKKDDNSDILSDINNQFKEFEDYSLIIEKKQENCSLLDNAEMAKSSDISASEKILPVASFSPLMRSTVFNSPDFEKVDFIPSSIHINKRRRFPKRLISVSASTPKYKDAPIILDEGLNSPNVTGISDCSMFSDRSNSCNQEDKNYDKPILLKGRTDVLAIMTTPVAKINSQRTTALPTTPAHRTRAVCSFSQSFTPQTVNGKLLSDREKVLQICNQRNEVTFRLRLTQKMMKSMTKIGEGVFGEVYKNETSAFKIIPIEGTDIINDSKQKKFSEILPEVVVTRELSFLQEDPQFNSCNFVQLRRVSLLKGKYPTGLLKLWDDYHKKKLSENDRPDIFSSQQLYLMLELENCGSDLESYTLGDIDQAQSVVWQVIAALAVAEAKLQFEHRDLHWGNILIRPTNEKIIDVVLAEKLYQLNTHGVHVSIIDFTLSRMTYSGIAMYTDLSLDPEMFTGKGDYQFDIYRLMRAELHNAWDRYEPKTNIFWIHYLIDKIINHKVYKQSPKSMSLLKEISEKCLECSSAENLFLNFCS